MNSIKDKIIHKANQLGFQKVGFAEAKFYKDDQDKLYSWIDNDYHATMEWVNRRKEERGNILKYFPEVKTVISFGDFLVKKILLFSKCLFSKPEQVLNRGVSAIQSGHPSQKKNKGSFRDFNFF